MSVHYYKTSNPHIKGICSVLVPRDRYRKGDVVYAEVEYEDGSGCKGRPVVYLGGNWKIVRYAKCTSVYSTKGCRIPVGDPISAGFNKETYIDPTVRYIERSQLRYYIGHLCDEDLEYLLQSIAENKEEERTDD